MRLYEGRFAFKAVLLIGWIVVRVYPVDDLTAISNDFANDVALERIALAEWVVSERLGLVFKRPSVDAFADIKGPSVGAA